MLKPVQRALLGVLGGLLAISALPAWAGDNGGVPDRAPPLGLVQSRPVFSLAATRHLEGLLVQHEHVTGERVFFVVRPWAAGAPADDAESLTSQLSERWKLDTTRRGAGVLLVLFEKSPGKISLAYRAGIGLARHQVASDEQLSRLRETLEDTTRNGSWDEIAEATTLWLLQSLESPLLENPDLLEFPKQISDSGLGSRPLPPASVRRKGDNPVTAVGALVFLVAALALVIESIRRGLKPQVLMGSRRLIRFGLQDQFAEKAGRLLRSSGRNDGHTLIIESLEGSR